jgi:hypothetical protein
MSVLDTVLSAAGGSGTVNQLAEQFGIDPKQTMSAVTTLLPALAGGMKEKMAAGDTSGLSDVITKGHLTQYADDPSSLSSPEAIDQGNSILRKIFGSGDTGNLISMVAEKVGISHGVIEKMLPIVATLFGAILAKKHEAGGKLTDTLDHFAHTGHGGFAGAVKSFTSKMFG